MSSLAMFYSMPFYSMPAGLDAVRLACLLLRDGSRLYSGKQNYCFPATPLKASQIMSSTSRIMTLPPRSLVFVEYACSAPIGSGRSSIVPSGLSPDAVVA